MAEVATNEQQMEGIVKKTIQAVEERKAKKKAILENIPSKFIISTWPIDPRAIKENTDYEFLILDTKWNDLNFNKYPGEGNYPHNRFLKIINDKKYICFYMRTENPTTLKQNKLTNESNIESFEQLLEITGFGENWVIIPKEYDQKEVEKKEKEEETEKLIKAKDVKQELMEKYGLSEEEITQDVYYKMEEFKNIISADAAINLVLKDYQEKNVPGGTVVEGNPSPIGVPEFEFQEEPEQEIIEKRTSSELSAPEMNDILNDNCSCACNSCKEKKHTYCKYECSKELFEGKQKESTKQLTQYKPIQGSLDLTIETVKNYLCKTATIEELGLFIHFCKVNGLDPFKKEAYIIKYANQDAYFHVSKDVFNKRASNQEDFGGLEAGIIILKDKKLEKREGTIILEGEQLVGGYCYAHRKDKRPFYAEANFKEFCQYRRDGQPNRFWKEKPALMIRKVAFAHALREAYPNELAGLYLSEELPQREE